MTRKTQSADGLSPLGLDPRYEGYFELFNAGDYFGAHDILEDLWLHSHDANRAFYKGLIQLAGAFVHLQKQYHNAAHPKHSIRARPAVRLLRLAAANLDGYRPAHLHLDVEGVWRLSATMAEEIERSGYKNPWRPDEPPVLALRG